MIKNVDQFLQISKRIARMRMEYSETLHRIDFMVKEGKYVSAIELQKLSFVELSKRNRIIYEMVKELKCQDKT